MLREYVSRGTVHKVFMALNSRGTVHKVFMALNSRGTVHCGHEREYA